MSTKGSEDKGSYPYDDPIPGKIVHLKNAKFGGYLTEKNREAERREIIVGLVAAATMLVIGFGFGFAAGVIYG